jgi:hypothetical protein
MKKQVGDDNSIMVRFTICKENILLLPSRNEEVQLYVGQRTRMNKTTKPRNPVNSENNKSMNVFG